MHERLVKPLRHKDVPSRRALERLTRQTWRGFDRDCLFASRGMMPGFATTG
jgi:hypothetical protein